MPRAIELLGRDLAAGHARHHGIRAAALDVRQEAVVGVLNRGVIDDAFVPQARQDRGDGRLADLAAVAAAVRLDQHFGKGLDPLDLDDLEQFLARAGEMLAEGGVDLLAGRLDLRP